MISGIFLKLKHGFRTFFIKCENIYFYIILMQRIVIIFVMMFFLVKYGVLKIPSKMSDKSDYISISNIQSNIIYSFKFYNFSNDLVYAVYLHYIFQYIKQIFKDIKLHTANQYFHI